MANSVSSYLVYIDTKDSEVTGPFVVQSIYLVNSTASSSTVDLYMRHDDGTTGAAGSGTDELIAKQTLGADATVTVTLNSPLHVPKLISGNVRAGTSINVHLA